LEDVLRFVNHLLANAAGARTEVSVEHEVDPETGLLSPASTRSVLGFECRHANSSLAIACLDIEGSSELRARVLSHLQTIVRANDVVGRLGRMSAVVILSSGGEQALTAFLERLSRCADGAVIEIRTALWARGDTPETLFDRASRARPAIVRPSSVRAI